MTKEEKRVTLTIKEINRLAYLNAQIRLIDIQQDMYKLLTTQNFSKEDVFHTKAQKAINKWKKSDINMIIEKHLTELREELDK